MLTNTEVAIALCRAAAFIGTHEGDWSVSIGYDTVELSTWVYETYEGGETVSSVDRMAQIRKSIGGKWDKHTTSYDFSLTHSLGDNVSIKLSVSRSAACTPRVVGTETVEIPDYSDVPTKTVTRDVIEYDCNPILDNA